MLLKTSPHEQIHDTVREESYCEMMLKTSPHEQRQCLTSGNSYDY